MLGEEERNTETEKRKQCQWLSYFWCTFEQRDENSAEAELNRPFEVDRFDPKSIIVQRSINF